MITRVNLAGVLPNGCAVLLLGDATGRKNVGPRDGEAATVAMLGLGVEGPTFERVAP